jgi:hypothetical protein
MHVTCGAHCEHEARHSSWLLGSSSSAKQVILNVFVVWQCSIWQAVRMASVNMFASKQAQVVCAGPQCGWHSATAYMLEAVKQCLLHISEFVLHDGLV